jgi:hypothetical protein
MTMSNVEKKMIELNEALTKNGGAECEQVPNIFFPEDNPDWTSRQLEFQLASAICGRCPVMQQCTSYALAAKEPYGIWGGLTPEHRRQLIQLRRQ